MPKKQPKFLVLSGGVISGLGKGVTLSSIGFFFSQNYKVVPIKLDGYLNSDPGTMNPVEHGEVFVLEDGFEVDMDFGHYERFIGNYATKSQSITMGKIFKEIRMKERKGEFLGKTVQMIPHVTNLIQDKILKVAEEQDADLMLIEVGGTVGDIENDLYFESIRQLEHKVGSENLVFAHLTYVPTPFGVKEQKTKPTQQSVSSLQNRGIWPEIIIGRNEGYLLEQTKKKIALFSSLEPDAIFSAPDCSSTYKLPHIFNEQGVIDSIAKRLDLKKGHKNKLELWNSLLENKKDKHLKVLIAGKYTDLEDSYASIVESLQHCGYWFGTSIDIDFQDTSNDVDHIIKNKYDAIIIPGGFGSRGVEGKIKIIRHARENKIPFLGICYGLQLAVIEFARNECGIKNAQTMEVDENTDEPVITLLDEQKNIVTIGGTMRLGSYEAYLKKGVIYSQYDNANLLKNKKVTERHRHRLEVNPEYVDILEKNGLKISGITENKGLVEFIEIPTHPYFVATQSHPELKSKLEQPAPLFYGLIESAMKTK